MGIASTVGSSAFNGLFPPLKTPSYRLDFSNYKVPEAMARFVIQKRNSSLSLGNGMVIKNTLRVIFLAPPSEKIESVAHLL